LKSYRKTINFRLVIPLGYVMLHQVKPGYIRKTRLLLLLF